MLTGFLTTALEIIIVLDIFGAIIYFAISGFSRKNQTSTENEQQLNLSSSNNESQTTILTTENESQIMEEPSYPYGTGVSFEDPTYSMYSDTKPKKMPGKEFSFAANIKRRITSFKNRFIYPSDDKIQIKKIRPNYRKLGQVLDSFREEM